MTFITDLVIHALKDHLIEQMVTLVPTTDASRVGEVKIGRFQKDPIQTKIYISISSGDQADPELSDGIVAATDHTFGPIGYNIPARTVGGGEMWWRRGRIQVGCFFIQSRMSEEVAASTAYQVLGRLLQSVRTCPVGGLVDDFGERALLISAFASNLFESGGPPSQYIWRGSVKFQVLTGIG